MKYFKGCYFTEPSNFKNIYYFIILTVYKIKGTGIKMGEGNFFTSLSYLNAFLLATRCFLKLNKIQSSFQGVRVQSRRVQ